MTQNSQTWTLTPRALEDIAQADKQAAPSPEASPAQGRDGIAHHYGTTGTADRRRALHAAERAAYRQALEQRAEHRSKALYVVHGDGRTVLVPLPAPRGDEAPAGGGLLDPATGHIDPGWKVATDGRLILITPPTSAPTTSWWLPTPKPSAHGWGRPRKQADPHEQIPSSK